MRTDKLNLVIKRLLGENAKKCLVTLLFPLRNSFILFNVSNRAKSDEVNLNYWDESKNLGDTLTPVIVNYVLSLKNMDLHKKVDNRKHLYAVGSVLTAGIQDTTVWGSGVLNSKLSYRLRRRKLDVRAVRGPLTRAVLEDYGYEVPEIYGDPAILMPDIFNPQVNEKKFDYGVILHKDFVLSELDKEFLNKNNVTIIDIKTADYELFVRELKECKQVISSSLHGIILSEVYGVPAVLLKPQVDFFKYYDYYFGTGRLNFPTADTLIEATMCVPAKIPRFENMRNQLIKVFPYDLFE